MLGAAPVAGGGHKASPLPHVAKRAPKANPQSSNTESVIPVLSASLFLPTAGELGLCLDPDTHFFDSALLMLHRNLKFEEKTFQTSSETQEPKNHSCFQCDEALNPSVF